MSTRRTPTPQSAVSSTPYDAMITSQKAHIDDLVQRNHTLDHLNKKLRDELVREETRSKESVSQMQLQWRTERAEWHEGCKSLQACHRIAHLRTMAELDQQRLETFMAKETARKEQLARLQRDYRLTMFQVREMELEEHVAELEDEVEVMRTQANEDTNQLVGRYQATIEKLRARCDEFAEGVNQKAEELAEAQSEKETLEQKYSQLHKEHAELSATAASTTSKLERTKLQLDSAQTANTELIHNNAELKRQMDNWQNLETRSGEEVESLRRRKIELEVQVKELEARKDQDEGKAVEKQRRRIEKLRAALEEATKETEEAQETASQFESEAADAREQVAKAREQIERLKAQLEAERAKPILKAPRGPPPNEVDESEAEQQGASENEVEIETEQPTTPQVSARTKHGPASKESKATAPKSRDQSKPGPSRSKNDRKVEKSKNTKAAKNIVEVDERSDVELVEDTTKSRGKRKAVSDEVEENEGSSVKKGRRRAAGEESGHRRKKDAVGHSESRKKTAKAGVEVGETEKPKRTNREQSTQLQIAEDDSAAGDLAPKKKKRKINFFAASQPTSFAWDQLAAGNGGGVDIPTELSPVKDTDMVPQRSIMGTVSSAFGFGRR